MATICIHHHFHDTFAAEAIAGMLIACGRVRLYCHDGSSPFRTAPRPDETLLIWTEAACGDPGMRLLARTLMVMDRRLLLLQFAETPLPFGVAADEVWPLFDHGVDWGAYRAGLRERLGYDPVVGSPSADFADHPQVAALPRAIAQLPSLIIGALLLSCSLIWSLIGG